jgi:hypothetical protein
MRRQLVPFAVLAALLFLAPIAARAESEFALQVEGGISHYNRALSSSNVGGSYGARLTVTPLQILGIELGYIGSRNNINSDLANGLNASTLTTNEGYADLRLNILPGAFTPYVFGGYGLTWVSGAEVSGVPSDHTSTIPFGGGLDFNTGAFKIGGRFQYNYLFDQIFVGSNAQGVPVSVTANKGGHTDFWTATLVLGVSFK